MPAIVFGDAAKPEVISYEGLEIHGFDEDDELLADSYTNFINNGQSPY